MDKTRKLYFEEEHMAHDARGKAHDVEEKLKKKKGGIFSSISSLQKKNDKVWSVSAFSRWLKLSNDSFSGYLSHEISLIDFYFAVIVTRYSSFRVDVKPVIFSRQKPVTTTSSPLPEQMLIKDAIMRSIYEVIIVLLCLLWIKIIIIMNINGSLTNFRNYFLLSRPLWIQRFSGAEFCNLPIFVFMLF